jgi:nucleotide-binding universal stress UspA family protein
LIPAWAKKDLSAAQAKALLAPVRPIALPELVGEPADVSLAQPLLGPCLHDLGSTSRDTAARACGTLLHDRRGAVTVLLAYIHTPDGDAALAAAVDEARWRATKAVVVNVTRPVAEVHSPISAEQGLDAVAALFKRAGVEVEVRQLPSSPDRAGDILAVMSEIQPEVVVIGMRKRSPVGELIIGSTSQRIIRGAECPVLVVKAPTS